MAIWGGVAGGTSAWASVVSMVARTIPLAPFLEGRGKSIKLSGGHPQTPAKEAVPLWTPPAHGAPIALATPPPVIARSLRRGNLGRGVVRSLEAEYLEPCHLSVVSSPLFHMY